MKDLLKIEKLMKEMSREDFDKLITKVQDNIYIFLKQHTNEEHAQTLTHIMTYIPCLIIQMDDIKDAIERKDADGDGKFYALGQITEKMKIIYTLVAILDFNREWLKSLNNIEINAHLDNLNDYAESLPDLT